MVAHAFQLGAGNTDFAIIGAGNPRGKKRVERTVASDDAQFDVWRKRTEGAWQRIRRGAESHAVYAGEKSKKRIVSKMVGNFAAVVWRCNHDDAPHVGRRSTVTQPEPHNNAAERMRYKMHAGRGGGVVFGKELREPFARDFLSRHCARWICATDNAIATMLQCARDSPHRGVCASKAVKHDNKFARVLSSVCRGIGTLLRWRTRACRRDRCGCCDEHVENNQRKGPYAQQVSVLQCCILGVCNIHIHTLFFNCFCYFSLRNGSSKTCLIIFIIIQLGNIILIKFSIYTIYISSGNTWADINSRLYILIFSILPNYTKKVRLGNTAAFLISLAGKHKPALFEP